MFFSFGNRRQPYQTTTSFGPSLLMVSVFCIVFGLAILAAPELLAYLVAGFLILTGAALLGVWWRVGR